LSGISGKEPDDVGVQCSKMHSINVHILWNITVRNIVRQSSGSQQEDWSCHVKVNEKNKNFFFSVLCFKECSIKCQGTETLKF
jgi:hypothetical protein